MIIGNPKENNEIYKSIYQIEEIIASNCDATQDVKSGLQQLHEQKISDLEKLFKKQPETIEFTGSHLPKSFEVETNYLKNGYCKHLVVDVSKMFTHPTSRINTLIPHRLDALAEMFQSLIAVDQFQLETLEIRNNILEKENQHVILNEFISNQISGLKNLSLTGKINNEGIGLLRSTIENANTNRNLEIKIDIAYDPLDPLAIDSFTLHKLLQTADKKAEKLVLANEKLRFLKNHLPPINITLDNGNDIDLDLVEKINKNELKVQNLNIRLPWIFKEIGNKDESESVKEFISQLFSDGCKSKSLKEVALDCQNSESEVNIIKILIEKSSNLSEVSIKNPGLSSLEYLESKAQDINPNLRIRLLISDTIGNIKFKKLNSLQKKAKPHQLNINFLKIHKHRSTNYDKQIKSITNRELKNRGHEKKLVNEAMKWKNWPKDINDTTGKKSGLNGEFPESVAKHILGFVVPTIESVSAFKIATALEEHRERSPKRAKIGHNP